MDAYLLARFFHIFFATLWLGLTIGGEEKALWFVREDLSKAHSEKPFMIKSAVLGSLSGLATIAAGTWLIFELGGWEQLPAPVQLGANAALLLLVIGLWPIGQGWRWLARARSAGTDQETLEAMARRIGLWGRVAQLLWVLVLVTMVFRHS